MSSFLPVGRRVWSTGPPRRQAVIDILRVEKGTVNLGVQVVRAEQLPAEPAEQLTQLWGGEGIEIERFSYMLVVPGTPMAAC